jgi:hypothetical protein
VVDNQPSLTKKYNILVIIILTHPETSHICFSPTAGLRCPQGSRYLMFPDYMTTAQDGGKTVSLMHRQFLPPGNNPGTHF